MSYALPFNFSDDSFAYFGDDEGAYFAMPIEEFAPGKPEAVAVSFGDVDGVKIGKFRADAPETSRKAAVRKKNIGGWGTARRRIYEYIKDAGECGATDDELERELRIKGSTVRPRRGELADWGYVKNSGRIRDTAGGDEAIVWVAT